MPELSVIIASYNSSKTLEKTLASLRRQQFTGQFEIIVVDSSNAPTVEWIRRDFPEVRLFTFHERKFPGDARNYGILQAKSKLIAFIDADCIADKKWVSEIVNAHLLHKNAPVIGGTVGNGNPKSLVGWAYYFCEFSQWMPGFFERDMPEIPTCCLSLKRTAFEKYGPFLEGTYCSDSAFNWKLAQDGLLPHFVPTIRVNHINLTSLRKFIAHAPFHGQSFARVRSREQHFSPAKRLFYAVICPALPFLLFFRTAKRTLQTREYLWPFIKSAPLVFLGLTAWAFGEFLGYKKPEL